MKVKYFAAMFVVLALFLASGCGGSSGSDVHINTNTNTNDVTSNDQTGNNTNNTNNNTGNTSLTFDATSYTTGTANGVTYRAYSNITYVASPVNESYQQLSVYIPEAYFSGGTVNGYSASTAPIFMANGSAGYMSGKISTPSSNNSEGKALAKGYVVVSSAISGSMLSARQMLTITFSRQYATVRSRISTTLTARMNGCSEMNYIGVTGVDTAQYWFIRHGTNDRDTSLAIPALLALKLESAGCTVDFKAVSRQGHGGDYDIDDILSSIDSILQ